VLHTTSPPYKSDFKDYSPCQGSVRLGDKTTINQVGVGSVIFNMSLGIPITLSNVLHIPGVRTCFLSTHVLAQKGVEISFAKDSFKVVVNQHCFAKGYLEDNLYWLDVNTTAIALAPEIMRSLQPRCQGMARSGPGRTWSRIRAPHAT
jgi:hypothetical protein